MTENTSRGVHERIRYHTQEQLALFAAFVLLAGWLGGRIDSGNYDILFLVGICCAAVILGAIARLRWAVGQLFKQLEAQTND